MVKRSDKCEILLTNDDKDAAKKAVIELRKGNNCEGPAVLTAIKAETVSPTQYRYTFTTLPGGEFTVCSCLADTCTVVKDGISVRDDVSTAGDVAKEEVARGVQTWDNIKGDLELSVSTITPILEHIQALATEIAAEQSDNVVAVQKLADLREDHERRKNELADQQDQLSTIEDDLAQTEKEKKEVQDAAEELKNVVNDLKQTQEDLEDDANKASEDFADMEEKLDQWMLIFDECGAIEEKKAHIKKLKDTLERAEAEVAETLQTLKDLEEEQQDVQEQVDKVTQDLEDEETELRQQEEDLEKMTLQKDLMIDIRLEAVVKVFRFTTGIPVSDPMFETFHPKDAQADMQAILDFEGQTVQNLLNNEENQLQYVQAIDDLCKTHFPDASYACVKDRWVEKVKSRFARRSSFLAEEEVGSSFLQVGSDELDPTSASDVFDAFKLTYTGESSDALADIFSTMMDKTKSRLEKVATEWTKLRQTFVRFGEDEAEKDDRLQETKTKNEKDQMDITKVEKKISDTQDSIVQVEDDIRDEKEKVAKAKTDIVELRDEINDLKTLQEKVISNNEHLQEDIDDLKDQTAETKQMIEQVVSELDKDCKERLEAAQKTKGHDGDVLGAKLQDALDIVEQWQADGGEESLKHMDEEVTKLKDNIHTANDKNDELKATIARTQQVITDMRQVLTDTNKQIDETKKRTAYVLSEQERITTLSIELEQMMEEYIRIMSEHASRHDKIHANFAERGKLNTISDNLEQFLHKYDLELSRTQTEQLQCGRADLQDVLTVMGIESNEDIEKAIDGSLLQDLEGICDKIDELQTAELPWSYCYGLFEKSDDRWKEERPKEEKAAYTERTQKSYPEAQRMKIEQKVQLVKHYFTKATTPCTGEQDLLADKAKCSAAELPKMNVKAKKYLLFALKADKKVDELVEQVFTDIPEDKAFCKKFCLEASTEVADEASTPYQKCLEKNEPAECQARAMKLQQKIQEASGSDVCY